MGTMRGGGSGRARILIVDDHAVVRDGLREMFAKERDLEVVGEARDRVEAAKKCKELAPDVVILDLSLSGHLAMDLVRDLSSNRPPPAVLVLSMHDEKVFAQRALQAGARGYVGKHEDSAVILRALRRVIAGRTFVSDTVSEMLVASLAEPKITSGRPSLRHLSDRELQILRLIGSGLRTTEIARRLAVGVKTVETHRTRIKDKLGLESANEVVVRAVNWVRDGFLDAQDDLIGEPTTDVKRSVAPSDGRIRVLVVDDDVQVRTSVTRALTRDGIDAVSVSGGKEALEILGTQSFDVALVDLRMPHMSGFDLLERIRAQKLDCEVVILTGFGDEATADTATRRGATSYLSKPVEPRALVREVRRIATKE